MKTKHLLPYRIIAVLIPILMILLLICKDFVVSMVFNFPPCPFYENFHLYCPACGNTRSVDALLHGDIIASLSFNISPIIFGIFFLLAYIEIAAYSFGKTIRVLPRKLSYYLVIIILLTIYVTIRNFVPNMIP